MEKRDETIEALKDLIVRTAEKTETAEEVEALATVSAAYFCLAGNFWGEEVMDAVCLTIIRFTKHAANTKDMEALRKITLTLPRH